MTPATSIRTNQRRAEEEEAGQHNLTLPVTTPFLPSLSNLAVNQLLLAGRRAFPSLLLFPFPKFPLLVSLPPFATSNLTISSPPTPAPSLFLSFPVNSPFSHPTIANPFLASFLFPLQPSVVGRVCLFTIASCAILYSSPKLPVVGLNGNHTVDSSLAHCP